MTAEEANPSQWHAPVPFDGPRRSWIARWSGLLALALILIASLRIVSTYRVLSHSFDEPGHLAVGIEWIENGTYTYEDQHPPLARVAGALGAHLSGSRWSRLKNRYQEGYHLLGQNDRYIQNLSFSRLFMLPFFWVASAVVYLWALRVGGGGTAVLATFLFTTTPPVLAHAGVVATDMALTAFVTATLLASLYWVEKPGWWRSACLGVMFGLALISKFSAIAFLPPTWLLMIAIYLWQTRHEQPVIRTALRGARALVPWAAFSAVIAALLVWASYRFETRYVPAFHLTLPAPAFFTGIKTLLGHDRFGHLSYLLGRTSMSGFWYFYPVVLTVKTPIATLILMAIAAWFAIKRRDRLQIAMPLALMAALLAVGLASRINIGVRHILPIYTVFAICGGAVLDRLLHSSGRWLTVAATALVLWQVGSGALAHPDYIAYTNELAGSHPERILADSDLDWIQGVGQLDRRLKELGVQHLTFRCGFTGYGYAAANPHSFPAYDLMPDGDHPAPGWNAVCVTVWKLLDEPKWADRIEPTERIGRSINLYYIPPGK